MSTSPTVVLVHGAFADASSYFPLYSELAGDDFAVIGLVYIAGYALDEGESLAELQGRFPDSLLASNLKFAPFPVEGSEPGTDVTCDPEAFPEVVCADAPIEFARFLAASQRPLAASAFNDRATEPAWKTKPCWGVVPTADNTINPEVHRFGFSRAKMPSIEIEGSSHLVIYSHPREVADVIRQAVRETTAAASSTAV